MRMFSAPRKIRGQGMTEYIIIVALIAVGAIAVYRAFGDTVRVQTSVAASSLAGQQSGQARTLVNQAGQDSNNAAQARDLTDFEEGAAN